LCSAREAACRGKGGGNKRKGGRGGGRTRPRRALGTRGAMVAMVAGMAVAAAAAAAAAAAEAAASPPGRRRTGPCGGRRCICGSPRSAPVGRQANPRCMVYGGRH
jgi:hypothetical protein